MTRATHVARTKTGQVHFSGKKRTEREHLEDVSLNGGIILKWILKDVGCDLQWIGLAQDRD
jgi:hypothetical protein